MEEHKVSEVVAHSFMSAQVDLEIKVMAVADDKEYDGTVFSTRVPIIDGEPASGHVVFVTQKYETKHSGETVLVPYIKILDESGETVNYSVTVQHAVGHIRPRPLAVRAQTDTKEYDGTALSNASPVIENIAYGDTAFIRQLFDSPEIGTNKTLMPHIAIDDGNQGRNYVITLCSVDTGTILARQSELVPSARSMIASYLGTDDFMIMKLDNGRANLTGEVCHTDDKCVYLKVEARKRVQLIIEFARANEELVKAEIGQKFQVEVKGAAIEVRSLGPGGFSPGQGRHSR